MDKQRVLVGSPIYQKPEILKLFLESLKNLMSLSISIDFMFVDDNINKGSSQILAEFKRNNSSVLKGVNFESIKNINIWGEDRFFCIRAAVLGIELFVDTHYPAYHIYRESDIVGVSDYIKANDADASFVRKSILDNSPNLLKWEEDEIV